VFSRTVISDNRCRLFKNQRYDVHLITKLSPHFWQRQFLV